MRVPQALSTTRMSGRHLWRQKADALRSAIAGKPGGYRGAEKTAGFSGLGKGGSGKPAGKTFSKPAGKSPWQGK